MNRDDFEFSGIEGDKTALLVMLKSDPLRFRIVRNFRRNRWIVESGSPKPTSLSDLDKAAEAAMKDIEAELTHETNAVTSKEEAAHAIRLFLEKKGNQ